MGAAGLRFWEVYERLAYLGLNELTQTSTLTFWWFTFANRITGCLLGGVYVPCIYCLPGGVIVGDSGLCCYGPVFNV